MENRDVLTCNCNGSIEFDTFGDFFVMDKFKNKFTLCVESCLLIVMKQMRYCAVSVDRKTGNIYWSKNTIASNGYSYTIRAPACDISPRLKKYIYSLNGFTENNTKELS